MPLVAQLVKNPPAMQETWIPSLGWEDPLGKGTAIHSSILAWRNGLYSPPGHKESDTTERLSLSLFSANHSGFIHTKLAGQQLPGGWGG